MNWKWSPAGRMRPFAVLLPAIVALLLTACGYDMHDMDTMHDDEGNPRYGTAPLTASLALQVTGSDTAAAAFAEPATAAAAPADLDLGHHMTLTTFRLGLRQVTLRPMGGAGTVVAPAYDHVADVLTNPSGHPMGPAQVQSSQPYRIDVDLWPMAGVDPGDPRGSWAMVVELTYREAATGFSHSFVLRWDGPVGFHMDGNDGLMMVGANPALILAFRMKQVPGTPFGESTILDAMLATPMDANGLHLLEAAGHPVLFTAMLEAMHRAMVFGEDVNHDGRLRNGDDPMVGHAGTGSMM